MPATRRDPLISHVGLAMVATALFFDSRLPAQDTDESPISLRIVTDQPEAALDILDKRAREETLAEGSNVASYLPTGHLVYIHEGALWAVSINPTSFEIEGSPTRVLDNLSRQFAYSDSGTLAYFAAPPVLVTLAWVDRAGRETPIVEPAGMYSHLLFSPDGKRIVFGSGPEGTRDIWIYDLDRGTRSRRTTPISVPGRRPRWK